MKNYSKVLIIVIVVIAAGVVLTMKQRDKSETQSAVAAESATNAPDPASSSVSATEAPAAPAQPVALPRMIELGSVTCIPCKAMAPILDELRTEYAGKLEVEFIDIKEDQQAGMAYGVRVMPTQVFLDAEGVEIFRHEGFFAKQDILKTLKELGISL